MFVKVIKVYYGVIYVTFSTTPYKIIDILLDSFVLFLNLIFRLKNMSMKDNLLTISKLQAAGFNQRNSKSYKLLNMTTLTKMLRKIRTSSF